MLILSCRKCGELQVLAGTLDQCGTAHVMWTCKKCGAGQILELNLSKDTKRGDLRNVIGGLALTPKTVARRRYFLGREGMKDDI